MSTHLIEGKYSFTDLVNIPRLTKLFNLFSSSTGFALGLVSYPEQKTIIRSGWSDICTKFHRSFSKSQANCVQSNLNLTSKLNTKNAINIDKCKSGMVDGATPIIIDGVHIANLFTGQVLFSEPNIEYFKNQGNYYGYDVDSYMEALKKVPIIEESKFIETLEFLSEMAVMLAEQGLSELKNKRVLQALQESEKKYKLLTNNTLDTIWSTDSDLKGVYVNEAIYNLLGYTQEEFINLNPTVFNTQSSLNKIQKMVSSIPVVKTANKEMYHLELQNIHKDGTLIDIDVIINPVYDENGNISGYTGRTIDVSESKKNEQIVRLAQAKSDESEQKFKAITNQSTEGITVADQDGNYVFVNPAFCEMSGYSQEELLKMTVFDMKAKNQNHNSFYESKQKLEGKVIKVNLRRKDGTEYFTEIVGKNIIIDKRRLVLGNIRDITERVKTENELVELNLKLEKQNEELSVSINRIKKINNELNIAKNELEESKNRLSTFMNSIPDIVCYKDRDGRWLLANKADLELFNLTNVDYFNKTDAELAKFTDDIYKEAFLTCMINDEKTWKSKKITHNVEIIPTKEGVKKVFDVFKIPIFHANGERKGLGVIGRDITELQDTQNKLLIAKERAEESDRLKSAFLANMSHEIRTPMNGIIGFADLLKSPDLTGDELKKYTGIIEKSGKRMLNIINDLIDISRIEAGQMEIKISSCLINRQVQYLYTFFKPEAEKKGLQIDVNESLFEIDLVVETDREKIYAILTNLIKNSIKYTNSGVINIGYYIKEYNGNSYFEFYVKDTGIGIPKERIKAIFERFIQAEIEDQNAYEGAGLGLTITKAYVEMLGGNIWVKSTEGVGSEFIFTIPIKTKEKKLENSYDNKPKIEANDRGIRKNLKVLIVEDEEFSDMYLRIILKDITDKIIRAKTGIEAIELYKSNPDIDLILMDIRMPVMNGLEATKEIRKLNNKVIVIAQTAHALQGDREKAIKAGCNEYIAKPVDRKELTEIIRSFKL